MLTKQFHVQTRGPKQEQDYRWFKILDSDQKNPEIPLFLDSLKQINLETQNLIDFQRPSIILTRSGKYLFLLVTALEAEPERVDYMNRNIRNSVAWTFKESPQDPENEKLIRAITILALNYELDNLVNKCVQSDHEDSSGFHVSYEKLQSIGKSSLIHLKNNESEAKRQIAGDSQEIRDHLCAELTHSRLPEYKDQLLVLVTTLKNQGSIQMLPVWRGISTRFSTGDSWIEIGNSNSANVPQKKNPPGLIYTLGIILITLLMLSIYLLT